MQDNLLSTKTSDFGFDGRKLLDVLRRRPLLIGVTTVLAPLAAFLYLARQAPVFQAQATLVIEAATPQYLGTQFRDVVDLENNWWSAQEYLATQYKIIQSRTTAVATAQTLCLPPQDPKELEAWKREHLMPNGDTIIKRFTGDPSCAPAVIERASKGLAARLEVVPVKETRLVNLVVRDADPHAARIIANGFAETYRRQNLERRLETTEGAATWLGDEYGDLTTQLHAAEQALVDFKKKNNVLAVSLDDQQNELSQRRRKVVDELSTVQLKLISLNAQREQYKGLEHADVLKDTSPQLQENPVIQKMKETYATEYQKLVELRGKYLEKHPSVQSQEARLEAIRQDIQNEARLSLKAIDSTYRAKLKEEKDLSAELDKVTRMALAIEGRSTEYNRLKRNFERLQKLSEQVGGREKESALAAHLKTNNVDILDRAELPESALKPNPLLVGAVAMLVGFLLGFGLAFLLHLLDSTIKTQDDIEQRLGLPFLGVIPRITPQDKDLSLKSPDGKQTKLPVELYIYGKPKSPVAECCRAIRTSLMFMSPDKPLRKMLVTSGEPQEGKSTTAVNLAITMALSGQRVLVVDTDMRRPRLHKIFRLEMTEKHKGGVRALPGFSSLVAGEVEPDVVVRKTVVPNLFVLPCGPIPPNPAELLHSERCKHVVAALGDRFDRVVFDSPPLGVVTDAAILSQLCDGTVLVAKSGKTSAELLGRARKLLLDLKANILGCILNDLDLLNRAGYGYRYYHYRYGQYYGDDNNNKDTPSGSSEPAASGAG